MFYELNQAIHVWGANASNDTMCKVIATVYGSANVQANWMVASYTRGTREEAIALARKTPK